ncbi:MULTISPECIES: IS607 family transposase [Marivita]|uniref:IS607 family transposase n=1 Tax=Marivita cryptomonadis TaxID=505252 RepID=A0A9Q2S277_9RHOB|nr:MULTISPECIES: IS607 family transposase [Marivita]MBM2324193.1 IS607 family transposase [Marivita cryptomonadis]MBM2333783.1 IS607 family transposase [Marivita cryptomonadis]MBM2343359.1 IS607 family transposase [Marivita cryptomonadis]MBM2348032.1 IS607 family transposase [Marivita cryptomonadis]MBM2352712.1 IS607 family transposase [Marivita cryptomonadis]
MKKIVSISKAAKALGVTPLTLRRWHENGKLIPDEITKGGSRRYDLAKLQPELYRAQDPAERKTIAYARVSSHDQKPDLERQADLLDAYCSHQGWTYEVVTDLGSGMNYRKKGLKRLLDEIIEDRVSRLVITHKDRLLRFGADLVFAICEAKDIEVVILNKGEDTSFEEDLERDVLEIITVFSARLYGARSRKNAKLLERMAKAVTPDGKEQEATE